MKPELITQPTLLLDETRCRQNIRAMIQKAKKSGTRLIPHFKTHQSEEIGRWFKNEGIESITVSSVKMAAYFAECGWKDITIAFPFNLREIKIINSFSSDTNLALDVIHAETAAFLNEHLTRKADVLIEIDAGYARTGVLHNDYTAIDAILSLIRISDVLSFYGFYIHPGHTYDVSGLEAVQKIRDESLSALHNLRNRYQHDWPNMSISVGDTPGCAMFDEFPGIDDIRPGNFVFFDVMQQQIGACDYDEIAVALAAPVTGKSESRNEILVYGGAIHLSRDFIKNDDDSLNFGLAAQLHSDGWYRPDPGNYVRKLSQEHGVIKCTPDFFDSVNPGDLIAILPIHSCLTADCMKQYLTTSGKIITMMNR